MNVTIKLELKSGELILDLDEAIELRDKLNEFLPVEESKYKYYPVLIPPYDWGKYEVTCSGNSGACKHTKYGVNVSNDGT